MKLAGIATVTALTALVVLLASASSHLHVSEQVRTGPVAVSSSSNLGPAPAAPSVPLEGNASSQPQDAAPSQPQGSPPSQLVSYDPPDAGAAPAVPPPPDAQVAALQQLVAQSWEENEQLGQIGEQLAALGQQRADEESRRQLEAEQAAAQHAATLEALGTLRRAEALLATGDSDGVDDELGRAEAALSGRTRLDVQAAREALARSDLLPARQYLIAALAERRAPR